jgi:8-oxo-dGTP pyrophosphatase MutT (NUDIX family)
MSTSGTPGLANGAPVRKNKAVIKRGTDIEPERPIRPPLRTYGSYFQSRGTTEESRQIVLRPKLAEKLSYGIACCRYNGNVPQILLVQRRFTYAFNAFVYGMYDMNNQASIMALLNKMTIEEKIILRRIDFRMAWSHIWISTRFDTVRFRKLEEQFNLKFNRDGGTRLHDLIARSANGGHLVWEIPKGRKRGGESDIHAAIREFYEETGVEKRQYYLYPTTTRVNTFIDGDVRYTHKYYIARADKPISPQVRLVNETQIEEISDIRWMSIDEVRMIDVEGHRLTNLIKPIFNFIKKNTIRI